MILLGLWLLGAALAATWTAPARLGSLLDDNGLLPLPAGVALRVLLDEDALDVRVVEVPAVRDPLLDLLLPAPGPEAQLATLGLPDGLLVPRAPEARLLRVEAPARTRVRLSTRREELAAWQALLRDLERGRDLDALRLPWGSAERLARVRLRERAVGDAEVRALGRYVDLEALRPVHRSTHGTTPLEARALPADEPLELRLEGPGVLRLDLRPQTEGLFARAPIQLLLDGQEVELDPLASLGKAWREERVVLLPGEHRLELRSPELALEVRGELARPRRGLWSRPLPGAEHRALDPFDQAELDWLQGRRAAAVATLEAWADQPGPRGDLARARLLEAETDPLRLIERAVLPASTSPDGARLAASAILRRAATLPPPLVELAVARADDLDPVLLARGLDGLGGQRARGTGLLHSAFPAVDDGSERPGAILRQQALFTRFSGLAPTLPDDPGPGELEVSPLGPGIPRVEPGLGQPLGFVLPDWGERYPVLRLRVLEPARFRIDGEPWESGPGERRVALEPGAHVILVEEGRLLLLDPEIAPSGAVVYERGRSQLPARYELPDPGARTELRLQVRPPGPVLAVFDDGQVLRVETDDEGRASLPVGARARAVELSSPTGADGPPPTAVVELRVRAAAEAPVPPEPVRDIEEALVDLELLSRAVDGQDAWARLARASLLGRMGQLNLARRDLLLLLADADPAVRAAAWERARNLSPATPAATRPGPQGGESILASRLDPRPLAPAEDPRARAEELERAAALHEDPRLWRAAGEEWARTERLDRAWWAAERAGAEGETLRQTILGRTAWTWLAWPESGGGLVEVRGEALPEPGEGNAEWKRIRAALLALPWPAGPEVIVLRGDLAELIHVGAGRTALQLFCRDERGPGRPCRTRLRVDDATRELEVPEGRVLDVDLGSSPRPRELELSGPGEGQALATRVSAQGRLLAETGLSTAHRVDGADQLYRVAAPALVRVDVLRGSVRIGEGEPVLGPGRRILALRGEGPTELRLSGRGEVRVYVGGRLPGVGEGADSTADEDIVEELRALTPETLLPVDVDALYARFGTPAVPRLREPGGAGSAQLGVSGHADLLGYPTERWEALQLDGRWMRADTRGWAQAAAWARGPGPAAGLLIERGLGGAPASLGLQGFGAVASSVTGEAGQVGALLHGRLTPSLAPDLSARLEARLRGAWYSPAPVARVDGRAWSRFGAEHPVQLVAIAALVASPYPELRAEGGLRAMSNTGPSLDRAGAFAGADLLLPSLGVLSLDGAMELRFADAHREEAGLGGRLDLRFEQGLWQGEGRWWRPWIQAGWRFGDGGPVASLGLDLLLSRARGLRDLPPGALRFRALRELP